jgi:hypothetical protein
MRTVLAVSVLMLIQGCSGDPLRTASRTVEKKTPDVILRLIRDPHPAAARHLMVLLPDANGQTGQMIVRTPGGFQTLDRAYSATEISSLQAAPSLPEELSSETVAHIFGTALSALPDPPVHFILYFKGMSSKRLLPESAAIIADVLAAIRQRQATDITIAGHADRLGTDADNLNLSSRRGAAVKRLLISAGVPSGHIDVIYYGERIPLKPTPDNVPEPHNRRVEVIVR